MYKSREELMANSKPQKELVESFALSFEPAYNTKISYVGTLRRYANYLEKNHIEKPIESDLAKYKDYLQRKGVQGASIQKYVIIFRKFYRWCERHDYYPDISTDLVGAKVDQQFVRQPFSIDEVRMILSRAKRRAKKSIINLRTYAIVNLIVKTGLRTIEVSRANVDDITVLNGTNYLYIQGKGKESKNDRVKLPDSVLKVINEYLEKRNSDSKALFVNHGKRNANERIQAKEVSQDIKDLFRLVGFNDKHYTAHSLRHTCATIALQNGATFQEVQMVLRHKSISTTTIYAHNIQRESNNVEFVVDKVIDKK